MVYSLLHAISKNESKQSVHGTVRLLHENGAKPRRPIARLHLKSTALSSSTRVPILWACARSIRYRALKWPALVVGLHSGKMWCWSCLRSERYWTSSCITTLISGLSNSYLSWNQHSFGSTQSAHYCFLSSENQVWVFFHNLPRIHLLSHETIWNVSKHIRFNEHKCKTSYSRQQCVAIIQRLGRPLLYLLRFRGQESRKSFIFTLSCRFD